MNETRQTKVIVIAALFIAALMLSNSYGEEQCKYTAEEITALRHVCEMQWLFGTCHPGNANSRQYRGAEKDVAVEAIVQTYMKACLKAGDVCK